MLASTSSSRLTSSMRATLRSMVRPRLSSEAHSSATPAFFDVLTSIDPDSVVAPMTRRWVGPAPSETISESSASPMRASMSRDRFWCPCSMRLIALWLVLELLGELLLGQPAVLARVPDEAADPALVALTHGSTVTHM